MVGRLLKDRRNKKGYSLEEVAEITHIRLEYLRDIENERFDRIPSELYVRGYLRSYARALDLNAENIIELYCGGKSDPEQECIDINKVPGKRITVREISLVVLSIAVVVTVFIFTLRYERTEIGTEDKEAISAQNTDKDAELKLLRIVAHETTWLIVVTDNRTVEEYVLKRGDILVKEGYNGFHLKIGNAGGVSVFLDNENIGYLGDRGQVVKVPVPEDYKMSKAFRQLFQKRGPRQ